MICYRWALLALIVGVSISGTACGESTTALSIHVKDQSGKPVQGAEVYGMYYGDGVVNRDTTNDRGVAKLVAPYHVEADISINKRGYYETSTKPYNAIGLIGKESIQKTYRLFEKRNPIKLYAMKFRGETPKRGERIGFDFSKGSWVAPYGNGLTADVYFKYSGWDKSSDRYDVELDVSFPKPGDGLMEVDYGKGENSEIRLPYKAPTSGYMQTKILYQKKDVVDDVKRSNNLRRHSMTFGYFFRTRTELGDTGNVEKARYSKIHGEILFGVSAEDNPWISFAYYHNPDWNERNLEFLVGESLFGELPLEETLHTP